MTKFLDYDGLKRVVSGLKSLIAEQKEPKTVITFDPESDRCEISQDFGIGDAVYVRGLDSQTNIDIPDDSMFIAVYHDGEDARLVGGWEPDLLNVITVNVPNSTYIAKPLLTKVELPVHVSGLSGTPEYGVSYTLDSLVVPSTTQIGDVFDIKVGDVAVKAIVSHRNRDDKPVALAVIDGTVVEVCVPRQDTVIFTPVGKDREPKEYLCRLAAVRGEQYLTVETNDIGDDAQVGDIVNVPIVYTNKSGGEELLKTVKTRIESMEYDGRALASIVLSGLNETDAERETFKLLFDVSRQVEWSSTRRVWNLSLAGDHEYDGEVYGCFDLIRTGDIIILKDGLQEGVALRCDSQTMLVYYYSNGSLTHLYFGSDGGCGS